MTVSRALRDDPSVSPETKSQVMESVAALGYRRNEVARSLRLGRSSELVGLVVTNLANPFYSQLALGVESYAARLGMRVILANSHEEVTRERQLVQDFAARRLDGVIVVPAGSDHAHLDPTKLGGIPVVLAASPPSDVDLDAVVLDDFGGTRQLIGELLGRAHERIGFLGLPASTWTGSERFRGYCTALEESGISPDENLVHRNQPDAAAAEQAARALLELPHPPTALFAANNRNTVGAYRAIRARGSATELAGFDDFELADALSLPLSVVAYDPRELGRQAARLLCDRIQPDSTRPSTARRVVVPTWIVHYANRQAPSPAEPVPARSTATPMRERH